MSYIGAAIKTYQGEEDAIPRRGSTYTTEQIFQDLRLMDSPLLRILWNKRLHAVQTSHMGSAAIQSWMDGAGGHVPAKDRLWKYDLTTTEEIPLFTYVDDRSPIDIFDAERYKDPIDPNSSMLWVTPVGFKCFQ